LTTAVREVGAVAYRVHSIPDDESQLQSVIEDHLFAQISLLSVANVPMIPSISLLAHSKR
jgi:hypothetical protein